MAGPAIEHLYRYPFPSALRTASGGAQLELATCGGPDAGAADLSFFRGRLLAPREAGDLLLAVSHVVGTRFYVPPGMLARMLREADPVVTCGEDRIRFEGFSACCGVYARVDFLPDALDGALLAHGTTNVDFNPALRTALTRLADGSDARLYIGARQVELETEAGVVTERKVPLPVRWLKGLVEVQAHQSRMLPVLDVPGAEARQFLRGLPRAGTQGRPAWVTPAGKGLRLSQVAAPGAVRVAGTERLRVLEELSRHGLRLRIFQAPGESASGWELTTRTARFHLVLSPEISRGFSGEGQVLSELAGPTEEEQLARIRRALGWQSRLDAATLAGRTGLGRPEIARALSRLGAAGLVGFDLSEGGYFHRVLPFDLGALETRHPRLEAARKLAREESVVIARRDGERIEAWIRSGEVEHHVRLDASGARCTCPWYGKHQGDRGPCKHVLAVQIELEGRE